MKRLVSILSATLLVCSLAFTSLAASSPESPDGPTKSPDGGVVFESVTSNEYIDVQIKMTEAAAVYNVVVEWDTMQFTYTDGRTWQPSSHTYTGTGGSWSEAKTVTVTNHSNRPVDITGAITDSISNDGVTPAISASAASATTLKSADSDGIYASVPSADKVVYSVSVSGDPTVSPDKYADFTDTGVITITIAATPTT